MPVVSFSVEDAVFAQSDGEVLVDAVDRGDGGVHGYCQLLGGGQFGNFLCGADTGAENLNSSCAVGESRSQSFPFLRAVREGVVRVGVVSAEEQDVCPFQVQRTHVGHGGSL